MAEYREEKVLEIVRSLCKTLQESNLNRSEGLNAVVQFIMEVATHDAQMADACARCIATAMVECLFAQPLLRHRSESGVHQDVERKKEGAN